jgi:hypothetical protein
MIHRICIVIASGVVSGYLGYTLGDRAVPFVQQWAEVSPKNVEPAQEIVVTWHGLRARDCPGTVYRQIVDACHEVHTLAPVEAIRTGKDKIANLTRVFRLPAHIAMGPAVYSASTDFVCNWTQGLPEPLKWPIHSQGVPVNIVIGDPSQPIHCAETDPTKP